MVKEKERESNIELLRILTIGGVILLHYIASPGEILSNVKYGSLNWLLTILINQICVCAVDLFVFISGYFSCKKDSVSIRKPIELIVEVIFFQCWRKNHKRGDSFYWFAFERFTSQKLLCNIIYRTVFD